MINYLYISRTLAHLCQNNPCIKISQINQIRCKPNACINRLRIENAQQVSNIIPRYPQTTGNTLSWNAFSVSAIPIETSRGSEGANHENSHIHNIGIINVRVCRILVS